MLMINKKKYYSLDEVGIVGTKEQKSLRLRSIIRKRLVNFFAKYERQNLQQLQVPEYFIS
jgi:hypothetical protein